MNVHNEGDQFVINQRERHLLIGLYETSIAAEIGQHIDANHPSDS